MVARAEGVGGEEKEVCGTLKVNGRILTVMGMFCVLVVSMPISEL